MAITLSGVKKLFSIERGIFLSIIILLCSVGGYQFYKASQRIGELEGSISKTQQSLSQETLKRIDTEKEKQAITDLGAKLYLTNTAIFEAMDGITKGYDDLNALILADDSRNVEIVKWMYGNAEFDVQSGTLAEARIRFNGWDKDQKGSNVEYSRIKAAVGESISELENALEVLKAIDLNTLRDDNSRVN